MKQLKSHSEKTDFKEVFWRFRPPYLNPLVKPGPLELPLVLAVSVQVPGPSRNLGREEEEEEQEEKVQE